MLITVLLFILGLVLLIFGGDWFVDGSCGLAKRFHIPELLIGATIVSIGTTLPEVMVSANSALSGHSEISYGNAIGSIICNTSLIAAITIAIMPGKVDKKTLRTPVIFFFGAAVFYSVIAYFFGIFSRAVGLILLAGFVVYILLNVKDALAASKNAPDDGEAQSGKLWKELLLLIVGGAAIAFGADLLVDKGILIAKWLGVPESVIGLTFVALGTSLPELVTAITSLIKGHSSLSLGNIIGANLFNLVLVSGISVTLAPFDVPCSSTVAGINTSLLIEIPLMLAVMAIMTLPALFKGRLTRAQGILLLVLYAGFCIFQFTL